MENSENLSSTLGSGCESQKRRSTAANRTMQREKLVTVIKKVQPENDDKAEANIVPEGVKRKKRLTFKNTKSWTDHHHH